MKKDILKPTPQQIKVRNRLWAEALKKNKKKTTECMYSENGGRCCLAVAQDVAKKHGVKIDGNNDNNNGLPDLSVMKFFGWKHKNPSLVTPFNDIVDAVSLNDDECYSFGTSDGMSHKKIAECVLNTYVHPKKKVWSFKMKNPNDD